jgi:hypothetical protein
MLRYVTSFTLTLKKSLICNGGLSNFCRRFNFFLSFSSSENHATIVIAFAANGSNGLKKLDREKRALAKCPKSKCPKYKRPKPKRP